MAADQVTFVAQLQDNVSPNLEKLEKQLKQAGQSPIQIKMTLDAIDQATPKIKEAQKHIDALSNSGGGIHLDIKGGWQKLRDDMRRAKEEITKPISMPFKLIDSQGNDLNDTISKLQQTRQQLAGPLMNMTSSAAGIIPGSGSLIGGVVGGGSLIGAATGLSTLLQSSISQNVELQQAHQKLAIALRDQSGATTELNKVIAANVKSPYTFQQTLQADVLARSYQLPVFKGENKNVPQGYLQIAENMAAAMGSTPDDAMMALAMARQHMFRRLQLYGIRMTRQDFGPGGRFAGQSVDQALQVAAGRRYTGSMAAQLQTFPGMMSNIKDVLNAQVIRPMGQNLFQSLQGRVGGIEQYLQTDAAKKKIGEIIQSFQHLTVEATQYLQKIKEYFDVYLRKPLGDIMSAIKTLGASFGQAFGGSVGTVIHTFAEAIISIVDPLASITKSMSVFGVNLGSVMGLMRGFQFVGMGGMVRPLQTFMNALNPQSGQGFFSGMAKTLAGLPSMALKLGGFFALKSIIDAHKATENLNAQFTNMPNKLEQINRQAADLAMNFGQSETKVKNLMALIASGLPMDRFKTPGQRDMLTANMGRAAESISQNTGLNTTDIVNAIENQMKQSQSYTEPALQTFSKQVIEAADVAKQFGTSWSDAMRMMQTFQKQAGPAGLGGLSGLPGLIALSSGFNKFGVTSNQIGQGIYTPDSVMQTVMQQYSQPSLANLRALGTNNVGSIWNFKYNPNAIARGGQNETTYEQQARAAAALQASARTTIGQIAPTALGTGQDQIPKLPVLWYQQHLNTNFSKFNMGQGGPLGASIQSPTHIAEQVAQAWAAASANYQKAVQEISSYNAKVDQLQNTLDQYNQAQAAVNLQMQAFQHHIQLAQRAIEDAQLALSEFTLKNLAPLEIQLNAVQNALDKVNHTMTDAQYNMTKFSDGLLTGEQSVLNQLHALSLYNEQLQYMQAQYTQIGAQLGTNVYERGYSSRVEPLMGLSLQMQMQQLQRRQQMAQMHYDITYGEGHYQMQQAARTRFQKQEMPLNERLKGIRENQHLIDNATVSQKRLGDIQFGLQQKMYHVNVAITSQQNHIQALTNKVTAMNQSGAMRQLQDEQYSLGQKIGETNIQLTRQQNILSQWQNTIDDLNQKKQDLQTIFDRLININPSGGAMASNLRHMIALAGQTGFLPGGHWQTVGGRPGGLGGGGHRVWVAGPEEKALLASVDKMQKTYNASRQSASKRWYQDRSSWYQIIKSAVWGAFTGDLLRKLGDKVGGVPGTILKGAGYATPFVGMGLLGIAGLTAFSKILRGTLGKLADHIPGGAAVRELPLSFTGLKAGIAKLRGNTARAEELLGTTREGEHTVGQWLDKSFFSILKDRLSVFLHPFTSAGRLFARIGGGAAGFAATGGHPIGAFFGQQAGGAAFDRWRAGKLDEKALTKAFNRGELGGQTSLFEDLSKPDGSIRRPFIVGIMDGVRAGLGSAAAALGLNDQNSFLGKLHNSITNALSGSVSSTPTADTVPSTATPTSEAENRFTQGLRDGVKNFKENVRSFGQHINPFSKAAREQQTASREALKASSLAQEAGKGEKEASGVFRRVSGFFGDHIKTMGRFVGKFGGAIGVFELLPPKWQDAIKRFGEHVLGFFRGVGKFISEGVSKFIDVIKGAFTSAIHFFQKISSGLVDWIRKIPGVKAAEDAGKTVSDVSKVGRDLSSTEKDASLLNRMMANNPQLKTILEHAKSTGAKVVEIGGKLFKWASWGAGALSFLPAGMDLLHGKPLQAAKAAANAGSYFIPGYGQFKLFGDLANLIWPGAGSTKNLALGPYGQGLIKSIETKPGQQTFWQKEFGTGPGAASPAEAKSQKAFLDYQRSISTDYYKFLAAQAFQHASTVKNTNSKAYKDDIALANKYQRDSQTFWTRFYALNQTQQAEFHTLTQKQQVAAQQAALTGPKGLSSYLTASAQGIQRYHQTLGVITANSYNNQIKTTHQGFQGIADTTNSWLGALTKTISSWESNNGLLLTTKKGGLASVQGAVAGFVSSLTSSVGDVVSFISGYASGGLVKADKHKIGPGRVVRLAEEGYDEMVIPLAPHRRDKAQQLLKQANARIGSYAAGGYVYPIPGFSIGRTDEGVDATAPAGSPILAMGDSRLSYVIPSWYAGQPLIGYQLENGPKSGAYWYISEQISPVTESIGAKFKAGQVIARYASSGSGLETGWGATLAASGGHGTLAQATTGYSEGQVTAAGSNFAAFISALSHGKILKGGPTGAASGLSGLVKKAPPIKLPPVPASLLNERGMIGIAQVNILEHIKKVQQGHLNKEGASNAFIGKALGDAKSVSGKFSHSQRVFIATLAALTGLDPRVVGAWAAAEEPVGATSGYQGTQDWLNVGITDSGPMGQGNAVWTNPATAARATAAWIKGTWDDPGFGKASAGIQAIMRSANQSPTAQMMAIANSGWASSGYNGGQDLINLYNQGYAGGMYRVPRDGMIATLHQDEMVVPASIALAARATAGHGGTGGGLQLSPGHVIDPLLHKVLEQILHGHGRHTHRDPSEHSHRNKHHGFHLYKDDAWVNFADRFHKLHTSIGNVEYDIHHIKRYVDSLGQKPTKANDAAALKALNAALRTHYGKLFSTQRHFHAAISKDLKHTGDKSGGENTVAALNKQRAILRQMEHHLRDIKSELKKLHNLQKELHHLQHRIHHQGHPETPAERRRVHKIEREIHRLKHRIHQQETHRGNPRNVKSRYIVGAAERGINPALLRAIVGEGLNKHETKLYHLLAVSFAHHPHSKRTHELAHKLLHALEHGNKHAGKHHATAKAHHHTAKSHHATAKQHHDTAKKTYNATMQTHDTAKRHLDVSKKHSTDAKAHFDRTKQHQDQTKQYQGVVKVYHGVVKTHHTKVENHQVKQVTHMTKQVGHMGKQVTYMQRHVTYMQKQEASSTKLISQDANHFVQTQKFMTTAVEYMKETSSHQKKVEAQMNKLIAKDTVINLTANIESAGTTVSSAALSITAR